MVLANGIYPDNKETFGVLKFVGLRRAVARVENGVETSEIERRVYDLRCLQQGMVIQVSLPGEVPERKFALLQKVVLVDPEVTAIPSANTFGNARPEWYVTAKDIAVYEDKTAAPARAAGGNPNPATAQSQTANPRPNSNPQGQERR